MDWSGSGVVVGWRGAAATVSSILHFIFLESGVVELTWWRSGGCGVLEVDMGEGGGSGDELVEMRVVRRWEVVGGEGCCRNGWS